MRTVVEYKNDISDVVSTLLVTMLSCWLKSFTVTNDIGNVSYKNSS